MHEHADYWINLTAARTLKESEEIWKSKSYAMRIKREKPFIHDSDGE